MEKTNKTKTQSEMIAANNKKVRNSKKKMRQIMKGGKEYYE